MSLRVCGVRGGAGRKGWVPGWETSFAHCRVAGVYLVAPHTGGLSTDVRTLATWQR